MADFSDPVEAAQKRWFSSGTEVTSTDVWHDRGWLMANIQRGHRDPMAHAAEIALRNLDRQEALAQRGQSLALHEAQLEQHGLEFEANQRRMMAHDAAMESHKQLTIDRDTEIDEQGHGLLQSMLQLDGALRNGRITKDQYDQGLLEAGQQYPLGTRHPEAAKHYNFAITEADKQNDFRARQEFREASRLGAKYGIGVQADPETGLPSVEHTRLAAKQTDKGRTEVLTGLNQELHQKYGLGTGVSSLFNPVAPHSSPDEGKTIDIPYTSKQGKVEKANVPMPLFNQMKADFQDRYFAVVPPSTTQPAGAVNVGASSTTAPAAQPQIPEINSAADYQALPHGSTFMSGGKQYTKPAEQAQ